MQGSYKKDGLPRPYYMKPRKPSVYDSVSARPFFTTSRRKLWGYLVLLSLIGTLVFFISQDIRAKPPTYQLADAAGKLSNVKSPSDSGSGKNIPDIPPSKKPINGKEPAAKDVPLRDSHNAMANGALEDEKKAEAVNAQMAKSPKETQDAVVVAPKGGVANEANAVDAKDKAAGASVPKDTTVKDTKADRLADDMGSKGSKGGADSNAKANPIAKDNVNAGAGPKAKGDVKNNANAKADLKVKVDAKGNVNGKADSKAKTDPKGKADVKARAEPKANADIDVKAKGNGNADAKANMKAESKDNADTKAEAKDKADLEAAAKGKVERKAGVKDNLERKAGAKDKAEPKAAADSEVKANARAKANLKADTDSEAKADLKAKVNAKAEANPKNKAKANALPRKEARNIKDGNPLGDLNDPDMNIAVLEAPKGGIANEANVVGNDKEKLMTGQKPPGRRNQNPDKKLGL